MFGFVLASVKNDKGESAPTIVSVVPDSPAAKAGLTTGEVVQAINGVPAVDLDTARETLYFAVRERVLPLRLRTNQGVREFEPIAGTIDHSLPAPGAAFYASIDAFLAMFLLLAFTPLARRDGETFALFLACTRISRFLLEEIRIDEPGMFGTGSSISQHISIAHAGLRRRAVDLHRTPAGRFAWPKIAGRSDVVSSAAAAIRLCAGPLGAVGRPTSGPSVGVRPSS